LKLQPDKCEFLHRKVAYLGHIITGEGVRPNPKKTDAMENFPASRNQKNIKQFLGLSGHFRRFIPEFSRIAKPLTDLLKKEAKFTWRESQEKAFAKFKEALCFQPLLQYPDFTK